MSQILVVDDEPSIRESLILALGDYGHTIDAAQDGYEALRCLTSKHYDLVVTDILMPHMNGLELIQSLRQMGTETPVIILTAHATVEKTAVAFKAGARDLLQKPFDLHNLVQSVQEALEFKPPATGDVESKLTRKTDEKFYQYYMDTIQSLFAVVEGKSEIVHGHCARVACYALLLAKRLDLMEAELRNLEILALVHDIGKIAVPNTVLEKKSPLTAAEDRILHSHVLVGEGILRPLRFLPDGDKVIRHHHEAFNGRGYPDGLSKENIPLFSRIIAIVDAFDNRLSARPYNVRSQEGVLADMKRLGGILFDPVLLEMFIQAYSKTMLLKTQSPAN